MCRPDYDESMVTEHMKGDDIRIDVHLNIGSGNATIWTCDLTQQYIIINADYRS
jgi:glutamate N-acetyltransferase/amino-acid N-acetyltransferase